MKEQRFVIAPSDARKEWRVSRAAAEYLRRVAHAARDEGVPQEVLFRPVDKSRTDPQRCTLWMWHGEVAAELSIRTGMRWTKDDVHESIFLEKFMPRRQLLDPETGEIRSRPIRTSEKRGPENDDRSMREIITDAMDAYLAWIYDMQIEVTVPESGW